MKKSDISEFYPLFEGETVIYEGEPTKSSTASVIETVVLIVLAGLSIAGDGFLIGASVLSSILGQSQATQILVFVACFIVHCTAFVFWLASSVKRADENKNRYIVITDKKLLLFSKKQFLKAECINFKDVSEIRVVKDVLSLTANEKKFKIKGVNISPEKVEALMSAFD